MQIHSNLLAERFRPLVVLDRSYLELRFTSEILDFDMEAQTQTNWCWAATSSSVSHFYSWLSPWTQCKVAAEAMDNTCCDSPVPGACNQSWYLNLALDITENFISYQSGTITWNKVKEELEKGLVIGARIGWNGGGGHFMVIYGVSKQGTTEYLHIDDPIYGKSTLTHIQFATNYQGSGTWTHTYFTKKKVYFMWFKDLIFDARLLEPIYKVRPMLDLHGYKGDLKRAIPQTAFSTTHYNYLLELNQIKANMELPAAPSSLRVVETDDEKALAIYEVSSDPKQPELLSISSDEKMFDRLDAGLEVLKKNAARSESTPELRSIRIPALNLEALWLHYSDETADQFKLVRTFDTRGFDSEEVYSEDDFKKLIVEAAAVLHKIDDEMGA